MGAFNQIKNVRQHGPGINDIELVDRGRSTLPGNACPRQPTRFIKKPVRRNLVEPFIGSKVERKIGTARSDHELHLLAEFGAQGFHADRDVSDLARHLQLARHGLRRVGYDLTRRETHADLDRRKDDNEKRNDEQREFNRHRAIWRIGETAQIRTHPRKVTRKNPQIITPPNST